LYLPVFHFFEVYCMPCHASSSHTDLVFTPSLDGPVPCRFAEFPCVQMIMKTPGVLRMHPITEWCRTVLLSHNAYFLTATSLCTWFHGVEQRTGFGLPTSLT
jgi:hypothetical protein